VAGMRISSTAINPASRTYYIEFLKDLAIVTVVFFNLDFLYDFIFMINSSIVDIFYESREGAGLDFITSVSGNGIIGAIVVGIIVLFLTLWANWYYMMRKLTLLILMILGPIMIALYLIPQFKGITVSWFKEFVGTVFVQSIHAILFWIVALITVTNAEEGSNIGEALINIESVILYLIFIPTGEAIRSLLGMGGGMNSNMSRAGAMFGMSALAGVYGSIKGALDKNNNSSVMGALKGAKDGASNVNRTTEQANEESVIKDATMAANAGTDSGTTPKADKMLKWGDVGSRAGKAIAGSAGSIGGAAIGGPMGSMAGATMGFVAGGVTGGLAGRGSKALTDLAAKNLKEGKNSFTNTWGEMKDPLKTNQEDVANLLADKETADYENEFKPSFVENAQKDFPDLDEEGIEQLWQDHKEGVHAKNLSNARNLVRKSTGKDGKLANAQSLANSGASEMTNRWAKENKDTFDKEYDSMNPLPDNATSEDIQQHEDNKAKAWDDRVASQKNSFQNIANQTANELKDESMGSDIVSKEDFAKRYANNLQENDKQDFIAEYQRQNPTAKMEDAESAYSLAKRNNAKNNFVKAYTSDNPNTGEKQAEDLYNMTQGVTFKDDFVNKAMDKASDNHKSQMEKTFDTALPYIKKEDRDGFIKDYQSNIDPSASREEAGELYDSAKDTGSKQMFMKNQSFTPSKEMRDKASKDYDLAQQYAVGDKAGFIEAYKGENKNTNEQDAGNVFNMTRGASSKNDYINKAMGQASSSHNNMMDKSYDSVMSYEDDKEGFINNYRANINPSATQEQASAIYDSAKNAGSKQQFMNKNKFVPTQAMQDKAGKEYDLAKRYSGVDNKESFVQAYQAQHPHATKEQAEVLFDRANSSSTGGQRSYLSATRNSIDGIKPESVFNKGANQTVNRGYLTNQLATAKTQQDKGNFIEQQVKNNVPESVANQKWMEQEKGVFQNNLSHFDQQLPQTIPMKQQIRKSDTMQKAMALKNASTSFVGNATGVTPIAKAVKNTAIKSSLASQSFKQGYDDGSQQVLESPENTSFNDTLGNKLVTQTKAVSSGISQGISNVGNNLQPDPETAREKQGSFQKAVAYTGGLVGGVKLYQKAGNIASRVNPYNKVTNATNKSGVYEGSEIRQMATQVDEQGQSYIPEGNIQLVSTPNQSYVQVKDSAGQQRIVSRYGAGDSALKQGQAVYQDLHVDDRGGLKTANNPYMYDTGGSKIATNRNMNINPNKLIATNRPQPVNPVVTQEVTPYNAKVETGSFTKQEAMNATENIRLVVTKNQSYMVGTDKGTGEDVRISPINPGDTRLDVNDVREAHYTVRNKRFNLNSVMDNKGNKVDYSPRKEVDDYLYSPRNPRVQQREQFENQRYKRIGGVD
jgi:hypothetical protein